MSNACVWMLFWSFRDQHNTKHFIDAWRCFFLRDRRLDGMCANVYPLPMTNANCVVLSRLFLFVQKFFILAKSKILKCPRSCTMQFGMKTNIETISTAIVIYPIVFLRLLFVSVRCFFILVNLPETFEEKW